GVQDDRRCKHQLQPWQAVHHSQPHHGDRQHDGNNQSRRIGRISVVMHSFRFGDAVTQVLNRPHEIIHVRRARVVLDRGSRGGEVHTGALHTCGFPEFPFDSTGAGHARHPGYWKVDALCRLCTHALTSYPSSRTAPATVSGVTRSMSYSTVAEEPGKSTEAF